MSVIQVGDLVQARATSIVPLNLRSSNTIYKVESVPDNQVMGNRFWELSNDGDLFIIDAPIILIKVDAII